MSSLRIPNHNAVAQVALALQAAQVQADDKERQRLARFVSRHADLTSAISQEGLQPSDSAADFTKVLQGLARD